MQVSRRQAARALDAMRRTQRRASARRRRARRRPAVAVRPWTMDRVLRRVADLPDIRIEVVADARSRHARGERVPAEAIADAALRRAACDRLR
jgi:hypothetical protein